MAIVGRRVKCQRITLWNLFFCDEILVLAKNVVDFSLHLFDLV